MASKQAAKRLSKEYQSMQRSPPPFVWARPNVLEWHYILQGPSDSPGEYWGTLLFPSDYPFAPPTIKFSYHTLQMMTPSGRFAPSQAICTSMSSFHPSTWNPAWSVNTILVGLLSFMLGDEITTGSVMTTEAEKQAFAKASHAWNMQVHQQPRFKTHFPEYSSPVMKNLPVMGSAGPPPPTQSAAVNPTTTTTTTVSTNGAALPVHSSSALIDTKKDERKSKTRTWFLWAFVVLLVSWGGMKVLE
ncbi:BZ3500_MvSof-1268-A1-R1_Chr4-2g07131 [Microbotryum saponariae]|uniref:BZ3500_MvSof-1268-A1-R1_Chr4-2g07131 protein n=1 Tax=Microbotryum saponariae TaxID=289078 RepID=A0A2X0NKZ0_9BASI|nr:BZ3500_MvSof-1268-A1-R1_Chr4-2g07131 [Microbotryum saponariae]SDA06796.1 BZ3501_MvSof-1269-A2-R1_Chr4-2g06842 [Microbotryum saponariae]